MRPHHIRRRPARIPNILGVPRDILKRDQRLHVGVVAGPDGRAVATRQAQALPTHLGVGAQHEAVGLGGPGPQRRDPFVEACECPAFAAEAPGGFLRNVSLLGCWRRGLEC